MWTWKLSGGVLFTTRVVRAAWALEPAPPAMALFVTVIVGLSALSLSMMALRPLAAPPVVHHETTSTCVTAPPGAFVPGAFVPGAFVPGQSWSCCWNKPKQLERRRRTEQESVATGVSLLTPCLLYTSDAADEEDSVDLGG